MYMVATEMQTTIDDINTLDNGYKICKSWDF